MTTSVDTNVIVALWDRDPAVSNTAQKALDEALGRGSLVLSAPVFAELIAAPGRTGAFFNAFCSDTGIRVSLIWMKRFGDCRTAFQHRIEKKEATRSRPPPDPGRFPDRRARVTPWLSPVDARRPSLSLGILQPHRNHGLEVQGAEEFCKSQAEIGNSILKTLPLIHTDDDRKAQNQGERWE